MKFSITDFLSKCDQIRRKLRIWSRLLKKSLMDNFIFCVVKHEKVYKCFVQNCLKTVVSVSSKMHENSKNDQF